MELKAAVLVAATLCVALSSPALSQTALPEAPAPAPAPRHANITELLSLAGPYGVFLDYLTKTDVIKTFQSQADDMNHQGVTLFAPEDSAFAALDSAVLANLTADQLRTLMLYHALTRYHPLSAFSALAASSPVATSAGGQYTVNITDAAGTIHVVSKWSQAKIVSSVYSTPPVAVYALNSVLLPEQIFPAEPAVAPAPAPAPSHNGKALDGAPSATGHGAPGAAGDVKSFSCRVGASLAFINYLVLMVSGFLMI